MRLHTLRRPHVPTVTAEAAEALAGAGVVSSRQVLPEDEPNGLSQPWQPPTPRSLDFPYRSGTHFFQIASPALCPAVARTAPALCVSLPTPRPATYQVPAFATPAVCLCCGHGRPASPLWTLVAQPPSVTRPRRCCHVRVWWRGPALRQPRASPQRPRGGRQTATGRRLLPRDQRAWPPRW